MPLIMKKHNYLNKNVNILLNCRIIEYDIKEGGFSIIKHFNLLPNEVISELTEMDNKLRNIEIGKLQSKSKDLAVGMVNGFVKAREAFYTFNNLNDFNILSIKKDAIFIVNKEIPKERVSPFIIFRKKRMYSSYLFLNGIEMYLDSETKEIDCKNLGKDNLDFHKDGMLALIAIILEKAETVNLSTKKIFLNFLKDVREQYLTYNLPVECYREMNNASLYTLNNNDKYALEHLDDNLESKKMLNITYNYVNYLAPLICIMMKRFA